MPDGKWSAFEIKLGANQIEAAAEAFSAKHTLRKGPKNASSPPVLHEQRSEFQLKTEADYQDFSLSLYASGI